MFTEIVAACANIRLQFGGFTSFFCVLKTKWFISSCVRHRVARMLRARPKGGQTLLVVKPTADPLRTNGIRSIHWSVDANYKNRITASPTVPANAYVHSPVVLREPAETWI